MMYFRDKINSIVGINDTPHRIALSFAIGVFMGISPFLGLHYIGGIFLAWIFRLNKLVAIIGVSVNNPWTIVPISTFCVWIGAKVIGIKQILPEVDWKKVTVTKILGLLTDFDRFSLMIEKLWPAIASFFVGSLLVCVLSAIASYFVIQIFIVRYRKIQGAT